MKIIPLLIGVVVLAGLAAWSLVVLPKESQQAELGAGIGTGLEKGIGKGLEKDAEKGEVEVLPTAEPAPPQEVAEEPPKENAIPVLLEPPQVKAGHKIKVTVGVPLDEVPIYWLVDIYLESSTGLTTVAESIINIDGEGRRFGNITIPQDAEPGVWKVKTIEITDTEGNITPYVFGTDIFSTFTVE